MEIKVQRIVLIEKSVGPLKAIADITIENSILVRGFRVVEGKHGVFVSVPQEQTKDRRWFDVVTILKTDLRKKISKAIISA